MSTAMDVPTQAEHRITLRRAEYDLFCVNDLVEELDALVSGKCVIDFRNVRYIDSSCLTALIRALKRVRQNDRSSSIEIVNARPGVQSIFKMTSLDSLFPVSPAAP